MTNLFNVVDAAESIDFVNFLNENDSMSGIVPGIREADDFSHDDMSEFDYIVDYATDALSQPVYRSFN
jgi:hypothetical protein